MARSAGLFSNPEAHRCWSAVFAVVTYANSRYGNGISFVDPFYRDWRFICPGQGRDEGGGLHWGVTCPYPSCPEGPGKYVSINIARIGSSNDRLYYVVAHELAHSWGRYHGYRDWNDEDWADRTAGLLGANVCSNSPYC
jgi:hypothetical protein